MSGNFKAPFESGKKERSRNSNVFTEGKAEFHVEAFVGQTPLALKASEIKENNAISHLTDDNIILYPLLPSDTLDQ